MAICKTDIRAKASGRWDQIILSLAPSIAEALDKPGLNHIDCPMHRGKNDFRVFRDVADSGGGVCTCGTWPDGFGLISAVNGWSFYETLLEVSNFIDGHRSSLRVAVAKPHRPVDTIREDRSIRNRLTTIWKGGISLDSPAAEPARLYLAGRGLDLDISSVRFHPALAYHDKGILTGHHPALVALVKSPEGLPVCIHRTYLSSDGFKAAVESPKKLCSHASDRPMKGAAIRLYEAGSTLAVAEGIETAMAVTKLSGIPCWATLTAGIMETFIPPPGVEKVLIFADKDRPSKYHPKGHGQESSRILAEALWKRGIKAGIKLPPFEIPDGQKGLDWLDLLNQQQNVA